MREFTKSEAIALAAHDHYHSILHLHGDRYGVWDAKGDSLVEFDEAPRPTTRIIQLTATVANPAKDGRKTDWTGAKTFDEGTRFSDNGSTIRIVNATAYSYVRSMSAEGRAILANSVEVEPETVAELIAVHECMDADLVLRVLFKQGRVNAADFKAAGEVINSEEVL
jgi:plasmid stability protein